MNSSFYQTPNLEHFEYLIGILLKFMKITKLSLMVFSEKILGCSRVSAVPITELATLLWNYWFGTLTKFS